MRQIKYAVIESKDNNTKVVYYVIVEKDSGDFVGFFSGIPEQVKLPENWEFMAKYKRKRRLLCD